MPSSSVSSSIITRGTTMPSPSCTPPSEDDGEDDSGGDGWDRHRGHRCEVANDNANGVDATTVLPSLQSQIDIGI